MKWEWNFERVRKSKLTTIYVHLVCFMYLRLKRLYKMMVIQCVINFHISHFLMFWEWYACVFHMFSSTSFGGIESMEEYSPQTNKNRHSTWIPEIVCKIYLATQSSPAVFINKTKMNFELKSNISRAANGETFNLMHIHIYMNCDNNFDLYEFQWIIICSNTKQPVRVLFLSFFTHSEVLCNISKLNRIADSKLLLSVCVLCIVYALKSDSIVWFWIAVASRPLCSTITFTVFLHYIK